MLEQLHRGEEASTEQSLAALECFTRRSVPVWHLCDTISGLQHSLRELPVCCGSPAVQTNRRWQSDISHQQDGVQRHGWAPAPRGGSCGMRGAWRCWSCCQTVEMKGRRRLSVGCRGRCITLLQPWKPLKIKGKAGGRGWLQEVGGKRISKPWIHQPSKALVVGWSVTTHISICALYFQAPRCNAALLPKSSSLGSIPKWCYCMLQFWWQFSLMPAFLWVFHLVFLLYCGFIYSFTIMSLHETPILPVFT